MNDATFAQAESENVHQAPNSNGNASGDTSSGRCNGSVNGGASSSTDGRHAGECRSHHGDIANEMQLFSSLPDEELLYDLADLFKTFSDTTRIKILFALMEHSLCVADIAELVGATQSAVSHQLRTLKQARLVKFQRDGKNVIYSLSDDHVFTMLAQGMTHICE